MTMAIQPLPPIATRVDACADQLRAAILDGTFRPGSRLPAERDLAERLQVTRVTLRGALARLAARGLVRAHQGRGTTVCDYQESGGPDLIGELLGQHSARVAIARDLLAVRRALAQVVLERIAEVRPDPAAVQAQVAAFEADVTRGADSTALAAADIRILRALLKGTCSPVLQLCLNPILRVLQGSAELRSALYENPRENLLGWQLLAAWVADPSAAQIPILVAALSERDRVSVEHLTG